MCGINGIFAYRPAANLPAENELLKTRDRMQARGPDGYGAWWSANRQCGLGHRRLSIIDLSERASQPMCSDSGRLVVTFNGEIYNYLALRTELERQGVRFRTTSDTEVLLHLYARHGAEMVHRLRGMFAFAIWDDQRGALFLARDPYGIKPLYYADDGRTFRFASQVKALIAGGSISEETDPSGVVGFYLFGSVPEPLTVYRNIRALPAGHTLTVDGSGRPAPKSYHSIAAVYAQVEEEGAIALSTSERRAVMRAHLLESVRHHLVADVPVGAFLSAGIDSGALVGLMRDIGQAAIQTVTISFGEFSGTPNDEAPLAERVACLYKTRHTTRIVTMDEFQSELPKILAAMDQPSIDGINTWFVSKAAHELGIKVAVSGLGGDELFGGYPAFSDIPRWVTWLAVPSAIPMLGSAFRRMATALGPRRLGLSAKSAGLIEYGGDFAGAWYLRRGLFMPWELEEVLEPDVVREGLAALEPRALVSAALNPMPRGPFARVATMETALYMRNQLLRDTDWASMAHSLEVRTPLADAVLLRQIAALGPPDPKSPTKQDLALAPSQPLPVAISNRKKTGFAVPVVHWTSAARGRTSGSAYGYARDWARFVARCQPVDDSRLVA